MSKRLPEGEGKRVPLNMRSTRELRDRLEAAADTSGRSIAQEVELRLEQSFRDSDFQRFVYGNEKASRLFHYIASILRSTKTTDGKDWNSDPILANVASLAVCNLLLSSSSVAFDALGMLRYDKELERRVIYAAQLISTYTILSYRADFDPEIMKGREGPITPDEAIQRFIIDGESI